MLTSRSLAQAGFAGLVLLVGVNRRSMSGQTPARVLQDVRFLAADQLAGRLTGSPGADSAATYIAGGFIFAGLRPAFANSWFQDFTISEDAPAIKAAKLGPMHGRNVLGILTGTDPVLREQCVIVGAHYDHLGLGEIDVLDPDHRGEPHRGADDNASGTAALLDIARQLAKRPMARSVIFIAFSGEEEGDLGSAHYVKHPACSIDHTVAMVNLDMVGRLRNDRLLVLGAGTATEFPALLDSLNRSAKFDLRASGDGYGPSDHASFYAAKLPVLHLFTDLHEDYHRASDTWERINPEGLERVATFGAALTRALAERRAPLTFVDAPPPVAPTAGSASGYGAYLGTIPDMSGGVTGVRVTGTRAGSPAATAGIQDGDIIRRIGDQEVNDLQGMTDALRAHQPGDVVDIVLERGGKTRTVRATLGKRGG